MRRHSKFLSCKAKPSSQLLLDEKKLLESNCNRIKRKQFRPKKSQNAEEKCTKMIAIVIKALSKDSILLVYHV